MRSFTILLVALVLTSPGQAADVHDPVPPPLHPREVRTVDDDPGPGIEIDYQKGRVTRRDNAGRLLWAIQLGGGLMGHREPHVLHDATRLYLSVVDGIVALDRKTGKNVWHAKGPSDRLHLSGNLLLSTECSSSDEIAKQGRWVIGREATTGKETFRLALPGKDFDPWPIRDVAGLFLVQAQGWGRKSVSALLFDRKGTVHHRFDRTILDGKIVGGDRVFLTSHEIVRFTAGKKVWTRTLDEPNDFDGDGGLVDMPGGDLVCYRYGRIHDSGVQVMRFDSRTGKEGWAVKCAPLNVSHSKYHHQASVRVDGPRLRVTSRGSGGSFVEQLDLKTGKQLRREPSKSED